MFSKYHYLSHSFNVAAKTYIATLNGKICAFSSWLPLPHPHARNYYRGHRLVVLPDFQGLNIGLIMSNVICEQLKQQGKHAITTTSNPARIAQLKRSPLWVATSISRKSRGSNTGIIHNKHVKGSTSAARITASFRYVG